MIILRYFLYARKSQERSDRQVASIDAQIREMKALALKLGIQIVEIFIEEKSAKQPGRPVFNEMIERINQGEADGILCWKLNRLARNPIDAGTISWLLQGNTLKSIIAKDRTYLPTDNVLMMQIDFGMANQFIKDLSSDTKRGLRQKAQNGWMPQSILPIGYMHHPEKQNAQEQVIPDPERFPLVEELWEKFLTGAYSILELTEHAKSIGLVNRKGKPYSYNTIAHIFTVPAYYGVFYWRNSDDKLILHQGKHKPMISEYEFLEAKRILESRKKQTRVRKLNFLYRGLIVCGECKGSVTAERKHQVICTSCKHKFSIITKTECPKCAMALADMENPSKIDIRYYHCAKRMKKNCSQKAINEKNIEKSITELLEQVSISENVYQWGIDSLKSQQVNNSGKTKNIIQSLQNKKKRLNTKITNLLDMRVSGELPKDQYQSAHQNYSKELEETNRHLLREEQRDKITLSEQTTYLDFARNCAERFKNGTDLEKRAFISYFCSNLELLDKSLYFSTKKAPSVLNNLQVALFEKNECSNLK